MAIERNIDIKFKVSGAAAASAQIDKVDTSLEGIDGSTAKASAGLNKTAKSATTAGRSFASMGEGMEQSLKPIDSTFKGFDRLNGILGQLSNATRILSGVAFIELGKGLVDVGKKVHDFASGAEAMRANLKNISAAAKLTEARLKAVAASISALTLATGATPTFEQFQRISEAERVQADVAAATAALYDRRASAIKNVAKYEREILLLNKGQGSEILKIAPGRLDPGPARNALAILQSRLDVAKSQVSETLGQLRSQRMANEAAFNEMKAAKDAAVAGARSALTGASTSAVPSRASSVQKAVVNEDDPGALGLDELARRVDAIFGAQSEDGTLFGSLPGMFDALKESGVSVFNAMSAAARSTRGEFSQFDKTLGDIQSGLKTVGTAAGEMTSALNAAGVQSAALDRLMAGVKSALAAADAVKEGAAAAEAFGSGNLISAAAHTAAAVGYGVAAVAYGAVATGAVGTGGSSSSSGASVSPPSRSDFGSSSSGGDGGGDSYTINVSAGQSLSTSRDVERAVVGALESALRTRGSGARRRLATAGM